MSNLEGFWVALAGALRAFRASVCADSARRGVGRTQLGMLPLLQLWLGLLAIGFSPAAMAEEDYLEPEQAFKFSARMVDPKTVEVKYVIADGYYMYRERFKFSGDGAKVGVAKIPPGKVKFDETFQKEVETHRNTLTILLPVEGNGPFTLTAASQGCADKGLCYAPMESVARLQAGGGAAGGPVAGKLDGGGPQSPDLGSSGGTSASSGSVAPGATLAAGSAAALSSGASGAAPSGASPSEIGSAAAALPAGGAGVRADQAQTGDSEIGTIEASLKGGKFLVILPLFFLLGLGLSFTPCVLPMVPILSFIIVGEGTTVSRTRGFTLSCAYALGMALVYTALGVAAGLIGEGLAASLQNPWVLGAFALLMVGLSLSMFDVYHLQVPAAIQAKLMQSSERGGGKMLGVFMMGAISALIVGPCVAAPLAGALLYISQTRDVLIGGGALFAMALGMSVPLLLVGVSAGALLPRAGLWMAAVKRFFGVLMLAMALWMVAPVIPAAAAMIVWSLLGLGYGIFLLQDGNGRWIAKTCGVVVTALGLMQLVGVASGGRDALEPLAHLRGESHKKLEFSRIKSVAQLDAALANAQGKKVMLDFYADWCVACKEMEKLTFTDARVRERFSDTLLLQVDVTANDALDKEMLKRFKLFGPPGIIFFDKGGKEIGAGRVIGYQDAERFLRSLDLVRKLAG